MLLRAEFLVLDEGVILQVAHADFVLRCSGPLRLCLLSRG